MQMEKLHGPASETDIVGRVSVFDYVLDIRSKDATSGSWPYY